MYKKTLFTVLLSVATICVSAQKFTGDLSPLKGQKEVNVELDWSGALVNGKSEKEFLAAETKGKSAKEKEQWLKEWNEDMRAQSNAMLTRDLNKAVVKKWFAVGDYPDAEYTIKIKVINITTGFFAGIAAKPSAVKATVTFVKKGSDVPIATAEYKKTSSNFSSNIPYFVTRIAMSFGKLGDDIASLINKKIKK